MNENKMIAILLDYVMEEKRHITAVPNLTSLYRWECDLLSVTKSMFTHEFEVKISRSDYMKDRGKKHKHSVLKGEWRGSHSPNYFWYAYSGFDLSPAEVPDYAGIVHIHKPFTTWRVDVVRDAPRLHATKLPEKRIADINRWLSYRIKNQYMSSYVTDNSRKSSA